MRAERLDAILRGEEVPWRALDTTPADLLDTCAASGIAELVHHHLARLDRSDWPDEVRGALARRAHAAAAVELVRGREVAGVLDALAAAVVKALKEGIEDVYPGDVAQEWVERWRDDPKVLERELAAGGG